jgi:hypothetical protein
MPVGGGIEPSRMVEMRVGCRCASFLPNVSRDLVLYAGSMPVGIGLLTVAIVVRGIMPFRVVVMVMILPPRIGGIIASVDTNRGITAAASDQDAKAAEDQEDARYHGVYSS